MSFDWITFLDALGIPYLTEGSNVKQGWVNIQCPFCGVADRSQHMGLNPETGGWACWRDASHRSMNTVRLVKALKGCSWAEAKQIVGTDEQLKPPAESWEELEQLVEAITDEGLTSAPVEKLRYPPEFKQIIYKDPYWRYLRSRGFRSAEIEELCNYYRLRKAVAGTFSYRLILPIRTMVEGLIGWQGRAIGHSRNRYLTYPNSEVTKRFLFNESRAAGGGEVLTVVEGPLDAYKVDWYGRQDSIRAVATLGTAFTDAQVGRIYRLASCYDRIVLLFDPDAQSQVMTLAEQLSTLRPIIGSIPADREDPGDLDPDQVVSVIQDCLD